MKTLLKIFSVGFALLLASCSSLEKAEELNRKGDFAAAFQMAQDFLKDEDPANRLRAVKLIVRIGERESSLQEEVGFALQSQLADSDSKVVLESVRGLGKLVYEPALEDLVNLGKKTDSDLLIVLAETLKNYGKPGIDLVVQRFEQPSEKANRPAYKQLLIQIGPEIADSIISSLKGKSFRENKENFEILMSIRSPKVAELLLPYLSDEEAAEQVKNAIIRLGRFAVDPTIRSLQRLGRDADLRVLEDHIQILGKLKDTRASEILESYQHSSERIRNALDEASRRVRNF